MVCISIIIPTCHRNDLLAKCLDRLAPGIQTFPPNQYEVIVTDDGSRSTAEQIVRGSYPWARWTEGPRRGPAANRNHGATLAQEEWLAFTDDDCLPTLGWLEAFAKAAETDGGSINVYEGKTTCEAGIASPLYEAPINLEGGNLWSCNFMTSASAFNKLGGFDDKFVMPAMEDTDFRERLERAGEIIQFVVGAVVDHPPRRKPSGQKLGKKYEANVQHWYKSGHRGLFLLPLLRHIKHQLYCINKYEINKDYFKALYSLLVEILYVGFRLPFWCKKFSSTYATTSTATECSAQT